jgi:hypothetical protein
MCLGEDRIPLSAMALCNSAQTVAESRILVHVRYLEILDSGT